jgi:hypothetical protein
LDVLQRLIAGCNIAQEQRRPSTIVAAQIFSPGTQKNTDVTSPVVAVTALELRWLA